MFGLAILFGLAVWCIVTLIAMRIGYKIGKQINRPKTGMVAGFMLTMGGWFMYWAIEFAYIQAKVRYLCEKEAGIKVYVTPEEYAKRLKFKSFNDLPKIRYKNNDIIFDGLIYRYRVSDNDRLGIIHSDEYLKYFSISRRAFIDKKTQVVLLKENSVFVFEPSISNDISGLKFWNSTIRDCEFDEQVQFVNNLFIKYEELLQ